MDPGLQTGLGVDCLRYKDEGFFRDVAAEMSESVEFLPGRQRVTWSRADIRAISYRQEGPRAVDAGDRDGVGRGLECIRVRRDEALEHGVRCVAVRLRWCAAGVCGEGVVGLGGDDVGVSVLLWEVG